jgi:hypothetical protein
MGAVNLDLEGGVIPWALRNGIDPDLATDIMFDALLQTYRSVVDEHTPKPRK